MAVGDENRPQVRPGRGNGVNMRADVRPRVEHDRVVNEVGARAVERKRARIRRGNRPDVHGSTIFLSTITGWIAVIFAPIREAISSRGFPKPRRASRFLIVGKIISSVVSAASGA